jgi:hypothetical protein
MKTLNYHSRSKVIVTMVPPPAPPRRGASFAAPVAGSPPGRGEGVGSWAGYLPLLALCLAALWPVESEAARANTKKEPSDQSLTAFKLIAERNIFNANRRAGSAGGAPPPPRQERQAKIEAFSLLGTMLHGGGMFAVFEGTESQYNKVLKNGDLIAGHKIIEVCANSVKLESNEGMVELPTLMQMRRRDAEPWQVIVGSVASSSSSSSANSSPVARDARTDFGGRDRNGEAGRRDRGSDSGRRDRGSDSGRFDRSADQGRRDRGSFRSSTVEAEVKPAETPASNISADEVLKRMMEKRAQELK